MSENDKAITTPLSNAQLGEYLRNRIGVPNGAYVWKQDLLNYGRTDVTFYKLDDEEMEIIDKSYNKWKESHDKTYKSTSKV